MELLLKYVAWIHLLFIFALIHGVCLDKGNLETFFFFKYCFVSEDLQFVINSC